MDTVLLIANLSSTPGLLRRLTEDVSPEQATGSPTPGEWSIAEVVRHLADGDRDTFLPRLRRMLAEDRPVFESRPREASADPLNLPTLLTVFESARSEAVKILNGLEPHAWLREGMSPSRGAVSVEAHAATMAAHDIEHLGQIHQSGAPSACARSALRRAWRFRFARCSRHSNPLPRAPKPFATDA